MREKKEMFLETLNRLSVGMSRAGDRLYGETKYIIDLSKLRLRCKDAQYEIRMEMEDIGRIYYESAGQAPAEDYGAHVAKIEDLQAEIVTLEAEMAAMQQRREAFISSPQEQMFAGEVEEGDAIFVASLPDERAPEPEEKHPCPHCGEQMSSKLAYCTNCHEKLN